MLVAESSNFQKQQEDRVIRCGQVGRFTFVHTPPDCSVSNASSNDSFFSDCDGAIGSVFSMVYCRFFLGGFLRVLVKPA